MRCFSPVSFNEGESLFLEGDHGDAMYVLAEGEVDVLRSTRGDRAVLLATLGPGTPLGLNALVEPGRRTASCVARTAGWAYTTDTSHFRDPPSVARTVWRESVLLDLSTQLRRSAVNLVRAGEEPVAPPEDPPSEGDDSLLAARHGEGPIAPSTEDPLDFGLEDDWG
jgi:CRP-like cAMP-binding protein